MQSLETYRYIDVWQNSTGRRQLNDNDMSRQRRILCHGSFRNCCFE